MRKKSRKDLDEEEHAILDDLSQQYQKLQDLKKVQSSFNMESFSEFLADNLDEIIEETDKDFFQNKDKNI